MILMNSTIHHSHHRPQGHTTGGGGRPRAAALPPPGERGGEAWAWNIYGSAPSPGGAGRDAPGVRCRERCALEGLGDLMHRFACSQIV